jgi:hypothetical protein
MKRQYDFLTSHLYGNILAYYKGGPKVKIKTCQLRNNIVYINGQNAQGWTFCLKPNRGK